MTDCEDAETRHSQEALSSTFAAFMEVLHLLLVELIECRGGVGPWLDELQANMIDELKRPPAEDELSDELHLTDAAIQMTNLVFDGARGDFRVPLRADTCGEE